MQTFRFQVLAIKSFIKPQLIHFPFSAFKVDVISFPSLLSEVSTHRCADQSYSLRFLQQRSNLNALFRIFIKRVRSKILCALLYLSFNIEIYEGEIYRFNSLYFWRKFVNLYFIFTLSEFFSVSYLWIVPFTYSVTANSWGQNFAILRLLFFPLAVSSSPSPPQKKEQWLWHFGFGKALICVIGKS